MLKEQADEAIWRQECKNIHVKSEIVDLTVAGNCKHYDDNSQSMHLAMEVNSCELFGQ